MESKNLDIIIEKPKSVTLTDGSEINLRPLSVTKALAFIDLAIGFRVNISSDLTHSPETREKVLEATEMLIKCSDYSKKKDWREDDNISLQVIQDMVDVGLDLNIPKSRKLPTT